MLEEGDMIPKFSLPDQSGAERTFSDLAGPKGLVIYAYPKDNTSGCTVEAQEFNEELERIVKLGFNVAGISKDSVKSHVGFAGKHGLAFPLLADPELKLLVPLGAYGEKKMYGKPVQGIIRSTFVFGAKGKLLKAWTKVKAAGHARQVAEFVDTL
jgi:thioredoxin-dependent peroxiredoxin